MRAKALSTKSYYLQKVLPKLLELGYSPVFLYLSLLLSIDCGNYLQFSFSYIFNCTCCFRAVRIAPFSNRLAHSVPPSIQALRCLANYEALQFSEPIRGLAKDMVDRMLKKSSNTSGKYISVHLRFEEVVASCLITKICVFMSFWLITQRVSFSMHFRIWQRFLVVLTMVERRRNVKWIMLGKGAGEASLEDLVG